MRDLVAAHFLNAPAPQAPARNPSPSLSPHPSRSPPRSPAARRRAARLASSASVETFDSHRRARRPLASRRVYRPARRHTLSRIDEAPAATLRPRSKSLQHSTDFSSTRPMLRSRSNISADTSRSVPVCNQSQDVDTQLESSSPQYAEPNRSYDSGSEYSRPDRLSMADLPLVVPVDPASGHYLQYPECAYYRESRLLPRWKYGRKSSSKSNLYLAFMY